ncbi:hypothetical protein F1189_10980 [Rhodovastum atsumiense]|uniref:Uncharacterized protein n=1 Tax=Rhodovastum atsumiense TaxID=504468 RepID=A0A5M6IW42_9PROT|nr:hypothetical protein F1189_10980 [Rhodovastum atsumiense]
MVPDYRDQLVTHLEAVGLHAQARLFSQPNILADRVQWYTDLPGTIHVAAALPPHRRAEIAASLLALMQALDAETARLRANRATSDQALGALLEVALQDVVLADVHFVTAMSKAALEGTEPLTGEITAAAWGLTRTEGQPPLPDLLGDLQRLATPRPVATPPPPVPAMPSPPATPISRPRWPWWWLPLALLLLLLAAGLVWFIPRLAGAIAGLPPPTACAEPPPAEAADLQDEELRLRARIAELEQRLAGHALQCRVEEAQRPPPTPPAPPPAPQPRAELPKDRWEQRDLSMLEGCWRNITSMRTIDMKTRVVNEVRDWKLCFDRSGHGQQTVSWGDGDVCQGSLRASFAEGGKLTLTDAEHCTGPGKGLVLGQTECRRDSDFEATCLRRDLEGGRGKQTGRFRR